MLIGFSCIQIYCQIIMFFFMILLNNNSIQIIKIIFNKNMETTSL
jgi:heme/copper-type cytochrome/quinol oxidase subunit 4